MRRALATVGALIALGGVAVGCGGGDDDDATPGGDGGGEVSSSDFCDQAKDLDETMSEVDGSDDAQVADAIDELRKLDPPAEIEEDYNTMIDFLDQLASMDQDDLEAMAEFAESDTAKNAQGAIENVGTYMEDECGIDPGDSADDVDVPDVSVPDTVG